MYSRQSSGPSTAHSAGPSPGSIGLALAGGSTGGVTSRKRSAPSDALTPLIGRPLAPKQPSTFGPETTVRPPITGYQPISPMVEPSPRLHEPRKKRGRPTKQEAEERKRQMEERQQRRMQAQVAQATHTDQIMHPVSSYGPHFGPPLHSVATGSHSQVSREDTPTGATIPPPIAGPSQTPRKPVEEEQNSSGSSGKKRKLRPPRLSVSDTEPPPPPSFRLAGVGQQSSSVYESPSHSDTQLEGGQYQHVRASTMTTGFMPTESEMSRFDTDDDNRPPNPRSRPWEVMRSGP